MLNFQIYSIFSGSFCQIYRVTDEALIAETAVWPNFFLMNVFFALKGSKLFIIIRCSHQMRFAIQPIISRIRSLGNTKSP